MKKILISLILVVNLFAYQKGDQISDAMVQHLGIKGDKVYVIDFFASWCGSCKKELPLIAVVNSKINSSKVEIIGIDVDKNVHKGIKFQESLKAKGTLNFRVVNDPQNLVIAKFNPIGMPTLYYVKEKKIVGIVTGAIKNIDEVILKDLKELE